MSIAFWAMRTGKLPKYICRKIGAVYLDTRVGEVAVVLLLW
jgi:hypothetical protein